MDQTLPKSERLRSRKEIEGLFSAGQSFSVFPFKVCWTQRATDTDLPLRVAFSVPKRKFKKAVDRNLLKRRSREAFRKNKQLLVESLSEKNEAMNVMFIYIADNKIEYQEIQLKIILILQRLAKMNG